jgi:hypothetical protein
MAANMTNVTCYVEVQDPTSQDYGITIATWPPKDKDRATILQGIANLYLGLNRPNDAQRFSQAVNQTPWTTSDDPK